MITVGLTGGIASGKSLVAGMFRALGAYVIDADVIAREVVQPHSEGWNLVVKQFGEEVLTGNGEIDRERLGRIIFTDTQARTTLNNLLHPLIIKKIKEEIGEIGQRDPSALVIVDIPLLIECGLERDFNKVIVVWAASETQIKRISQRNGLEESAANKRLAAQLPFAEKSSYADYCIDNDQSVAETQRQVREISSSLKELEKSANRK